MPTTSSPTSSRRSRTRNPSATAIWLGVSGLLIALAFLLQSLEAEDAGDPLYDPALAVGGAIQYAILVLIAVGIARMFPRPLSALGLRRFRSRWLWTSFGVVILTVVVSLALEPVLHGGEEQGLAPDNWEPEHATAFVLNSILIVLVAPFAEELFFRGVGVRVLTVFGGTAAILLSGIVFGLVHGILGALPALALFGIGLAWIRLRSGSVWPGFIAHSVYNGLGILFLIIAWATDAPVS